jgi:hypothetical protein
MGISAVALVITMFASSSLEALRIAVIDLPVAVGVLKHPVIVKRLEFGFPPS